MTQLSPLSTDCEKTPAKMNGQANGDVKPSDTDTESMLNSCNLLAPSVTDPMLANGHMDAMRDDVTSTSASSSDVIEKGPKRERWSRKIDFLLACIGFSVGLGNVWRFPYLCYKNGGGAFLLPYFLCVAIAGIPLFYLEVAVGQFMSSGGIRAWRICPLLQGIGIASTVIVFLLNTYYNIILSWAFYYLFSSFTAVLPWSTCNNYWNTPNCYDGVRRVGANESYATNATSDGNETLQNVTGMLMSLNSSRIHTDPVTEFWERKVLQISTGIDQMGSIKWDLTLCLLLAWIVVYFCIWKGVKSSGKVMYFTATSPYILMTILLVRGCTLPGAIDGIKFYVIPEFHRLADPQVWVDAGTQIFFSYSLGLGALTALGSYNKFHHNSWRDSLIFACTNSGTSFFAGFLIFSVLGFMAHEQGVSVKDVAESGPGLAFIVYPKAVSQMPVAPLWSILFFIMVLLLGLDSQFVGVEGFVTAVSDLFENKFNLHKGYNKQKFIAVIACASFLIGLSMVSNGGMYVFQLFDYYSGSRIILLVALFQCIAVAWLYGADRFYDNIEMMYGFRISPYMKYSWKYSTPLFTIVLFAMCIASYSDLTYNRVYKYPMWAIASGWMLACSSIIMIPISMVYKICRVKGTFKERIQKLLRPRLAPHQLRPEDSPLDLDSEYCMDSYPSSPELQNITISTVPVPIPTANGKPPGLSNSNSAHESCI